MMPTMPMAVIQPVVQVLACIYCGSQLCSTACYPTHKDQYTCHVWRCPGRNPVAVVQVPGASNHAVQAQGSGSSRPAPAYTSVPTATSTSNYLPTNPQFQVTPPARHSMPDTFRAGQQEPEHSPHQGMNARPPSAVVDHPRSDSPNPSDQHTPERRNQTPPAPQAAPKESATGPETSISGDPMSVTNWTPDFRRGFETGIAMGTGMGLMFAMGLPLTHPQDARQGPRGERDRRAGGYESHHLRNNADDMIDTRSDDASDGLRGSVERSALSDDKTGKKGRVSRKLDGN
ncbi:hypothetical protein B0T20DRAFT_430471 [Sordaria brevicollis]|uniref:Uncharacterized protein n=1 Tax=Sordaria brevicollis TaxID=83679 RepID=A0AAE0UFH9_SORBR|nr:hypothetical protein B0T20DRAFT_430471 [Sordaria brevicollis]